MRRRICGRLEKFLKVSFAELREAASISPKRKKSNTQKASQREQTAQAEGDRRTRLRQMEQPRIAIPIPPLQPVGRVGRSKASPCERATGRFAGDRLTVRSGNQRWKAARQHRS